MASSDGKVLGGPDGMTRGSAVILMIRAAGPD